MVLYNRFGYKIWSWLQYGYFLGITKPRPSPGGAFMVETRGVELLSENIATYASMAVSFLLNFDR